MLIRRESITYSKRKARRLREQEESINKEITHLRLAFAHSGNETDLKNLTDAQETLERIREPKIHGAIVRSRVRWHDNGERCSNYFLSLEKRNVNRKSIHSLLIDGENITTKNQILSEFTKHLENKYKVQEQNVDANQYTQQYVTKKLSDEQKQKLDEPITFAELTQAITEMKKGRSPGSNGYTSDFFKHFWTYLGIFLFRTMQQSITDGSLSLSHKESIVTLIPKTGKALNSLKDWRPISLLNVDFKIISAAMASRLKRVIHHLVSPYQSAYIKGRFIGENTRLVYDLIHKTNANNESGLILAADFEAAFESVSWSFLDKILKSYNFGLQFKNMIRLLYLNSENFSRIILDGFLGDKIHMQRGIRQGDPISGYLFNLVVEPLANQLVQSSQIRGIEGADKKEIRVSQYADDLIVFLKDSKHIDGAIAEIQTFSTMSGLKLNLNKTKCLKIGKNENQMHANRHGI